MGHNKFAKIFDCRVAKFHIKYLGAPLSNKMSSSDWSR